MTVQSNHIEFYSGFLIDKLERQRNKILLQSFDKTLRKKGKTKYSRSRELNTFMVAHAHLNPVLFKEADNRKRLENNLRAIYKKKYLSYIKINRKKALKKDLELKTSRKALLRAHRHLPETEAHEIRSLVKTQFEELINELIYRFDEMNEKTMFTLWDLPGVEQDRLVLYNQIITRPPSVGTGHEDIGELVDEMALIIFGYRFLHHLEVILKSPLALAESGVQILNYYRSIISDPSPTYEHKEDLTNVLRVLLGKVLGLRDILKVCKREIVRFETILSELGAEAEHLQITGIVEIAREYVDPNVIKKRLSEIEIIESVFSDIGLTLRDLVHECEFRPLGEVKKANPEEINLLKYILDFYIALEGIRFWTDMYADIAQFTVLKGGVAFEYGEITDIPVPEDSVLYARDLFKQYELKASTVYALRGCDVDIKRGEFVSIIGPSGSGKTTLLNILSGLDIQDRGDVYIDGINVRKLSDKQLTELRRDKMGFIFQFYNLLPILSNRENVALPADLAGKIKSRKARALELLSAVGLRQFSSQFPNKLSGGQMQRVTVARSLMNNPAVLFADEPTGDLDSVTGEEILQLLQEFHKQGSTIVLVTHDLNIAQHAERIILMKDGQIQDISHEEITKMVL
ncbi:MAG: ABC transporter ATP-binding protein [Candidatus Hodarchaeota archaeon]